MSQSRTMRTYQSYLDERLQDPQEALNYLNGALIDKDQRVFLQALKNVVHAQGSDISALALKSNLNRENLYRMLSEKGNPRFTSLRSVLQAMDLELSIIPASKCT